MGMLPPTTKKISHNQDVLVSFCGCWQRTHDVPTDHIKWITTFNQTQWCTRLGLRMVTFLTLLAFSDPTFNIWSHNQTNRNVLVVLCTAKWPESLWSCCKMILMTVRNNKLGMHWILGGCNTRDNPEETFSLAQELYLKAMTLHLSTHLSQGPIVGHLLVPCQVYPKWMVKEAPQQLPLYYITTFLWL